MNEVELNKRIHEILDMCWHSGHWEGQRLSCEKCSFTPVSNHFNIYFTTSWEGFGLLLAWWKEFPRYNKWFKFRSFLWNKAIGVCEWADDLTDADSIPIKFISPLALTQATVEFFMEEKRNE